MQSANTFLFKIYPGNHALRPACLNEAVLRKKEQNFLGVNCEGFRCDRATSGSRASDSMSVWGWTVLPLNPWASGPPPEQGLLHPPGPTPVRKKRKKKERDILESIFPLTRVDVKAYMCPRRAPARALNPLLEGLTQIWQLSVTHTAASQWYQHSSTLLLAADPNTTL